MKESQRRSTCVSCLNHVPIAMTRTVWDTGSGARQRLWPQGQTHERARARAAFAR